MDNIKKNMKKIWNSKCKYLVIVACALILVNGVNLLQTSLKFLNPDGEEAEEIKMIGFVPDIWGYRLPGSWRLEKSAEWTNYKEATIRFDIDTMKKVVAEKKELEVGEGADVILVLDISGSMGSKNKLIEVKEDAKELVELILSDSDHHKIALITFDSNATLKSNFTNDKGNLLNQIDGLKAGGGTNYAKAYQAVINLLSGYSQNQDRDLVMLFLTDGDGTSAKAQYTTLKEKYNINIQAIQYDMGRDIKQKIIDSYNSQSTIGKR